MHDEQKLNLAARWNHLGENGLKILTSESYPQDYFFI